MLFRHIELLHTGGQPERSLKWSKELEDELYQWGYTQMTYNQIASSLGIAAVTFDAMRTANPKIAEIVLKGRSDCVGKIATCLLENAQDRMDVNAQKFLLERKGGWKAVQGFELSGPDGKPISTVNINADMPPDEAAKLYLGMLDDSKV